MIAVQAPATVPNPLSVPANAPEHCPVRIHVPEPRINAHIPHRALNQSSQAKLMLVQDVPTRQYALQEQQSSQILRFHSLKNV